ncbi:MAG: hypothetical protein ACI9Y7_002927 [Dokdonia sp.]|jgi:hypothetical protein
MQQRSLNCILVNLLSLPGFWLKCKSSDFPIRAFETFIGDSDISEIPYGIIIDKDTFLAAFYKKHMYEKTRDESHQS